MLSFLLLFYAAILHVSVFWNGVPLEPLQYGVFSELVYAWVGKTGWLPQAITIVLLFVHGTILNGLNLTHRFIDEVNLYPGLFYVLIACLLPEFLYLSPLHMANTFYLLALVDLMAIYNRPRSAGYIFNAGLWIGIGSLFYFSWFIFVLLAFIALRILRAFDLRERLMVLAGVLVPYILAALSFFWVDQLELFFDRQFGLPFDQFDFRSSGEAPFITYLKLALFTTLLLIVLFSHNRYLTKKTMQVQKKINLLFWGMVCAGLTLLFQPAIQLDHLLMLAPPLGLLLAINFTGLRRNWGELFHALLVLTALGLQFQRFLLGG